MRHASDGHKGRRVYVPRSRQILFFAATSRRQTEQLLTVSWKTTQTPHQDNRSCSQIRTGHITDTSVQNCSYMDLLRKCIYKGADKSLARPGRKQANVSVRMTGISFGALPCRGGGGGLDMSSRLDGVEIACVPDMLPSLFPSWSG